ncbi:MAG TPA: hypothetical protein VG899_15940 [Mycobacteriales bacterium]|nr:hypothetical protein [Mycobacteriales bacterium]
MTSPDDIDLLAASLRADAVDLDVYSRVLSTSLAEALPPEMLEVEHDQSMRDRIAGRPGKVIGIRILLGETTLELEAAKHLPTARVVRRVRGVTIANREVDLAEWSRLLADALAERARESTAARDALAGLLGQSRNES